VCYEEARDEGLDEVDFRGRGEGVVGGNEVLEGCKGAFGGFGWVCGGGGLLADVVRMS